MRKSLSSTVMTLGFVFFVSLHFLFPSLSQTQNFSSESDKKNLTLKNQAGASLKKKAKKKKNKASKNQAFKSEVYKESVSKRPHKKKSNKNLLRKSTKKPPKKAHKGDLKKAYIQDDKSSGIELDILDILDIFVVPKIRITEKKSLKSTSWWKNKRRRVPSVYKKILRKIKKDFRSKNINLKYKPFPRDKGVGADKMSEDLYVIFGDLVLDKKNSKFISLENLRFFKFKDLQNNLSPHPKKREESSKKNVSKEVHDPEETLREEVSDKIAPWIVFSRTKSYNLESDFGDFATDIKEEISLRKLVHSKSKEIQEEKYKVLFKSNLEFNELSQIKYQVIKELNLDPNQFQYFYLEEGAYTFVLRAPYKILKKIQKLTFIKGPYKSKIVKETLIFEPYTDDDLKKYGM